MGEPKLKIKEDFNERWGFKMERGGTSEAKEVNRFDGILQGRT